jgi:hypothetical protein
MLENLFWEPDCETLNYTIFAAIGQVGHAFTRHAA